MKQFPASIGDLYEYLGKADLGKFFGIRWRGLNNQTPSPGAAIRDQYYND